MGKLLYHLAHKYQHDLGALLFDRGACHLSLRIPKNDNPLQSFASRDMRALFAQQHLGRFFVH